MEFPKFIPDSDVDPTDDTSLLLLSLIDVVVVVAAEAPLGSEDDLFEDDDDDTFFAAIATNATKAHVATTIMAIFLELFVVSIGAVALPVLLVLMPSSDEPVELVVVSLKVGLETGDDIGVIVDDGGGEMLGTAVGLLNIGLGVSRGSGKLMERLNDRLSPNKPRKLLEVVSFMMDQVKMIVVS